MADWVDQRLMFSKSRLYKWSVLQNNESALSLNWNKMPFLRDLSKASSITSSSSSSSLSLSPPLPSSLPSVAWYSSLYYYRVSRTLRHHHHHGFCKHIPTMTPWQYGSNKGVNVSMTKFHHWWWNLSQSGGGILVNHHHHHHHHHL